MCCSMSQPYGVFLFISLLMVHAQALKVSLSAVRSDAKAPNGKTAHIYVINLDKRKDRCLCMKEQLKGSPYELFRQKAITPETLHECPVKDAEPIEPMRAENKAVFCSNQVIFDKVHKMQEENKPDFIIVLEDDLEIRDRSLFWQSISNLLNSPCSDASWDVLHVDTFDVRKKDVDATVTKGKQLTEQCEEFEVYKSTKNPHFGAHFQIIKKDALPRLLERRMSVQDHDADSRDVNVATHYWLPRLVGQASQGPKISMMDNVHCAGSIGKGDNNNWPLENFQFAKDMSNTVTSHDLEC
eukprot:gnl/MRDRNA2_/MRDRNA2_81190_c0_seq1.p1 gnl/MRDRNA2_/MRDRNA2_81190_c0~~gnl/MRDRNA2_/MRDRNA2_81190_c0_seq1.p1  ORF type:complete len:298 (+),score=56.32 gnl/MRDRNA2_/MRDRNA2_81190_c0_seq1:78-971(+)